MNTLLRVDLHCHSFFSDGELSPEALIDKAMDARIGLLALTDHDTIAGVARLHEAAQAHAITIISGVELSVRWKMHDIHILGLNIDSRHASLTALLEKQNNQRSARAKQMSEALERIGVQHAYQKAYEIAGHERIGRPHLAQVLINEGIVKDMQTAFDRYLKRGRLAYVPTSWISVDESVKGVLQSGGMAVLAHPMKYKLTRSKLNALINDFKLAGGQGLEVVSGDMNISQIGEMAGLCERFELLASSGSDYHSDHYSRIKLGHQLSLPLNCKPIWEQWINI